MRRRYSVVTLLSILIQQEVMVAANPCIDSCSAVADGNYQSCLTCSGYLTCANGLTFQVECSPTLEWDDNVKTCDFAPSPTCNACTITSSNTCAAVGGLCTDTAGTVTCECIEGFVGDGTTCTEIPEVVYTSCSDVYTQNSSASSGSYTIQNGAGESYSAYCDFYPTHLYEYIQPTNLTFVNIGAQFNDQTEFMLRYRLANGRQFEVKIQQIRRYRAIDISIQYNVNSGFGDIQNTQMGPYLYVGLLPVTGIRHLFDRQGYSPNGRDSIFINCNGSPFSYFALLFNSAGEDFSPYNYDEFRFERWLAAFSRSSKYYRQTVKKWLHEATEVSPERQLPVELFSKFEFRFGGCGGYLTSEHIPEVDGITIGLKSDITRLTTRSLPETTTPLPTSTTPLSTPVSTSPVTTLPPLPPLPGR